LLIFFGRFFPRSVLIIPNSHDTITEYFLLDSVSIEIMVSTGIHKSRMRITTNPAIMYNASN
jgi:hypothetical protein